MTDVVSEIDAAIATEDSAIQQCSKINKLCDRTDLDYGVHDAIIGLTSSA